MPSRPSVRVAAGALGVAMVLGFGAAALAAQGGGGSSAAASPDFGVDGPGPSDRPDPALSGSPVPTLPPGDPGTESATPENASDEPGPDASEEEGHGDAVTEVPASAMLDPQTVGDLAGGSWSVGKAETADACLTAAPDGSTASRAVALASTGGRLVQTVSAHRDVRAAKASVDVTADRLAGCGFTPAGDPRLGEASSRLTRTAAAGDQEVAVVISADGVSVVLVAAGSAAADGVWESLADVAMGTSCAAAADACH